MDTKLDIKQIEFAIARHFGVRDNIIVPNISWGFFSTHEADLLIMSKTGYLTEVEIKRSYNDLLADFKKTTSHYEGKVEHMYYAVPVSIAEKSWKAITESFYGQKVKCGLLTYYESGFVKEVVTAPSISSILHRNKIGNRLFLEERLKLARLGVMRYWSMQERILTKQNYEPTKDTL